MNKKSFCVANWKMNKDYNESKEFLEYINKMDLSVSNSNMIICPSFTSLSLALNKNSNISFGSQTVSSGVSKSQTGEISIDMLESVCCDWVIIGHSERRNILKETNEDISKKMELVFNSKLKPILCIGESLEEKNNNQTENILLNQINSSFSKIDLSKEKDILIAYEPIWAIGTGVAAEINIIDKNMKLIKKIINNISINNCNIYLLYGGSVNEYNASEIFNLSEINGFLIGGASLNVDSLYSIYKQI